MMNSETSVDDEEEEMLLYLDFQSKINPESLEEPHLKIKMIGIDSDEPIVQINNKMFRGTYEHAMGTNVFFTENPSPPPMDPNFESIPAKMYKFHSQTNRVLKMSRIFATPKKDEEEHEPTETQNDEDDVPSNANISYSEALNQFLLPYQEPPRVLSGTDLLKPSEFQLLSRRMHVNEEDDDAEKSKQIADEEESDLMEICNDQIFKNESGTQT